MKKHILFLLLVVPTLAVGGQYAATGLTVKGVFVEADQNRLFLMLEDYISDPSASTQCAASNILVTNSSIEQSNYKSLLSVAMVAFTTKTKINIFLTGECIGSNPELRAINLGEWNW